MDEFQDGHRDSAKKKKKIPFKAKMTSALGLYDSQEKKYIDHHKIPEANQLDRKKHNRTGRQLGHKLREAAMKFAHVNDSNFNTRIKLLPDKLRKLMYAFRKAIIDTTDYDRVIGEINTCTAQLFEPIHDNPSITFKSISYTLNKDSQNTFLQNIDMLMIHAYLNTYRMGVKDNSGIYEDLKDIRERLKVPNSEFEKSGGSEADYTKLKSDIVWSTLSILCGGGNDIQKKIMAWCNKVEDVVRDYKPSSASESNPALAAFSSKRPAKLKKLAAVLRRNIKRTRRGSKNRSMSRGRSPGRYRR